ncbi:ATP-binding protein [Rhizobium tropici]|uniref:Uncharacterized protein n=1 Tax=Rhizobium tropici TaxID=398 RepID=A0A329Y307_RHITR|nr:ATP-binding protein [Rhizobium tropici]RAX37833.1 hypothetical protein DQ393_29515 [Rhizobium tropici]
MTENPAPSRSTALSQVLQLGSEAKDILLAAAVKERWRLDELIDDWFERHPDADGASFRLAMHAAAELERASSSVIDRNGQPARELTSESRLNLLETAGVKLVRALTKTAGGPNTLTETLFHALLNSLPVGSLSSPQELLALRTAAAWAQAAGVELPFTAAEIERKERIASFEAYLAGPDLAKFVGRRSLLRVFENLWDMAGDVRPSILLSGAGGIGKSLTVAKFLLDRLRDPNPSRRPLAILHFDFDRFDLQDARLGTFVTDALRQVGKWWLPHQANMLMDLARIPASFAFEGVSLAIRGEEATRDDQRIVDEMVRHLPHDETQPPLIAVFADTFEKVDSYNPTAAQGLRDFCEMLRFSGADVFEIYASRSFTRPSEFANKWTRKPAAQPRLGRLGQRESILYLKRAAAERNIAMDDETAHQAQVALRRMPLRLRLAVALMGHDSKSFDAKAWLEQCSSEELGSDAILYERVLNRLRDPLKKLAKPGLLLRRLSAELISEVLADACGLPKGLAAAEAIMTEARKDQAQLFFTDQGDPDALWHIDYVRSEMLDDLVRDIDPEVFRMVHRLAVEYYARRPDTALYRAEELYSRLQLEEDAEVLDQRWTAAAGRRLRGAVEELPLESARYVRTRTAGGAVGSIERDASRYEEFRLEARRRLQSGNANLEDILERAQVKKSAISPLGDIYVQSLLATGRSDEALAGAIELRQSRGRVSSIVRLGVYSTAAALLEARGNYHVASEFWSLAEVAAENARAVDQVAPAIGVLRSRRRRGSRPRQDAIKRATALVLQADTDLFERPVTAREAVAELAEQIFDIPRDGIGTFLLQLGSFLMDTDQFFLSRLDETAGHRIRLAEYLAPDVPADGSAASINRRASKALYSREPELVRLLIDAMRREVDASLKLTGS